MEKVKKTELTKRVANKSPLIDDRIHAKSKGDENVNYVPISFKMRHSLMNDKLQQSDKERGYNDKGVHGPRLKTKHKKTDFLEQKQYTKGHQELKKGGSFDSLNISVSQSASPNKAPSIETQSKIAKLAIQNQQDIPSSDRSLVNRGIREEGSKIPLNTDSTIINAALNSTEHDGNSDGSEQTSISASSDKAKHRDYDSYKDKYGTDVTDVSDVDVDEEVALIFGFSHHSDSRKQTARKIKKEESHGREEKVHIKVGDVKKEEENFCCAATSEKSSGSVLSGGSQIVSFKDGYSSKGEINFATCRLSMQEPALVTKIIRPEANVEENNSDIILGAVLPLPDTGKSIGKKTYDHQIAAQQDQKEAILGARVISIEGPHSAPSFSAPAPSVQAPEINLDDYTKYSANQHGFATRNDSLHPSDSYPDTVVGLTFPRKTKPFETVDKSSCFSSLKEIPSQSASFYQPSDLTCELSWSVIPDIIHEFQVMVEFAQLDKLLSDRPGSGPETHPICKSLTKMFFGTHELPLMIDPISHAKNILSSEPQPPDNVPHRSREDRSRLIKSIESVKNYVRNISDDALDDEWQTIEEIVGAIPYYYAYLMGKDDLPSSIVTQSCSSTAGITESPSNGIFTGDLSWFGGAFSARSAPLCLLDIASLSAIRMAWVVGQGRSDPEGLYNDLHNKPIQISSSREIIWDIPAHEGLSCLASSARKLKRKEWCSSSTHAIAVDRLVKYQPKLYDTYCGQCFGFMGGSNGPVTNPCAFCIFGENIRPYIESGRLSFKGKTSEQGEDLIEVKYVTNWVPPRWLSMACVSEARRLLRPLKSLSRYAMGSSPKLHSYIKRPAQLLLPEEVSHSFLISKSTLPQLNATQHEKTQTELYDDSTNLKHITQLVQLAEIGGFASLHQFIEKLLKREKMEAKQHSKPGVSRQCKEDTSLSTNYTAVAATPKLSYAVLYQIIRGSSLVAGGCGINTVPLRPLIVEAYSGGLCPFDKSVFKAVNPFFTFASNMTSPCPALQDPSPRVSETRSFLCIPTSKSETSRMSSSFDKSYLKPSKCMDDNPYVAADIIANIPIYTTQSPQPIGPVSNLHIFGGISRDALYSIPLPECPEQSEDAIEGVLRIGYRQRCREKLASFVLTCTREESEERLQTVSSDPNLIFSTFPQNSRCITPDSIDVAWLLQGRRQHLRLVQGALASDTLLASTGIYSPPTFDQDLDLDEESIQKIEDKVNRIDQQEGLQVVSSATPKSAKCLCVCPKEANFLGIDDSLDPSQIFQMSANAQK